MIRSKKSILVIVLVLVVIAIGVVAVVGGRKDDKNDKKDTANTTEQKQDSVDTSLLGEKFSDAQTGVSMQLPKGWQQEPKGELPGSLVRLRQTQEGSGATRANGELTARKSSASMDDIVRTYLEARINMDINSSLVENKEISLGGKPGHLLVQDIPGPNGQTARITQYIFYKKGTFYILTFTMLATDWETQQPAIEASAKSLEIS